MRKFEIKTVNIVFNPNKHNWSYLNNFWLEMAFFKWESIFSDVMGETLSSVSPDGYLLSNDHVQQFTLFASN